MGDIVDKHVLNRRRIVRDFWLRITIPAVLFAGLLVLLFTSVPLDALPPALLITGAALLIGGAIGFFTDIHGPHWPIYALIFTGLAVLLLLPHPWRGLTFRAHPDIGGRVRDGQGSRVLSSKPSTTGFDLAVLYIVVMAVLIGLATYVVILVITFLRLLIAELRRTTSPKGETDPT